MVNIVSLLTKITTVSVSSVSKFTMNKETQEAANIGWMGSNFQEFFFGKTEENISEAKVAAYKLEKASLDPAILEELGGEAKAEMSLAHFVSLIQQQSQGQEGTLLVNGYANVAYIRDNGKLWAVCCYWYSGRRCWDVGALLGTDPRRWHAGYQILSCDS